MSEASVSVSLGNTQGLVSQALGELLKENTVSRIWSRDHTVWKPSPTEILDRLGWLDSPRDMAGHISDIVRFTDAVRADGYTQVLLLGMGGSSLAPEVFRKIYGVAEGYPDLAILDSTDPAVILKWIHTLDLTRTLFLVSTKSGGTVETFSFLKYFYNQVAETFGPDEAGRHFAAITDPGSGLADLAESLHFRHVFYNDPCIGGRYSALSYFGLIPAGLIGMDLTIFLASAMDTIEAEQGNRSGEGSGGATGVGTALGELARSGRDKLTFVFSPQLSPFGDWVEQLIAESTGKDGKGILPVVGEPLGAPDAYGADRLFVAVTLADDGTNDASLALLERAGHPVIRITMLTIDDLGGQFFFWELATAIAGARLGINPFDQPNVESAKGFARQIVATYQQEGGLPEEVPDCTIGPVSVFGWTGGETLPEILDHFLGQSHPGDYVAIHAYVAPAPAMDAALQRLRLSIRDRYRLATTVGYGPRFLHSTGQLHKGDAGCGFFLQITVDDPEDADIPDRAGERTSGLSFGTLKAAQGRGDRQALMEAGRRVLRFHLAGAVIPSLEALVL